MNYCEYCGETENETVEYKKDTYVISICKEHLEIDVCDSCREKETCESNGSNKDFCEIYTAQSNGRNQYDIKDKYKFNAPKIIDGVNWFNNIPELRSREDIESFEELIGMIETYWDYRNSDLELKREKLKITLQEKKEEVMEQHIDFLNRMKYHVDMFYDSSIDYENIDPIICPVKNKFEKDMWEYFRMVVSRLPKRTVVGKNLRVFVKDKNSGTVLGLLSYTSPMIEIKLRDIFYNTQKGIRDQRSGILEMNPNISTCIPLYPFSMFTGGKLMIMMTSTSESFDMWNRKYGIYPFGVHTTSIYGKSIQYDRIKEWKYVGKTKGYGLSHLAQINITKIIRLLKKTYPYKPPNASKGMMNLLYVVKSLGLIKSNPHFYYHGIPRGIYCFKLINDEKRIIDWFDGIYREQNNAVYKNKYHDYKHFDNLQNKFLYWKKRWFERRFEKYKNIIRDVEYDLYVPEFVNDKKRTMKLF